MFAQTCEADFAPVEYIKPRMHVFMTRPRLVAADHPGHFMSKWKANCLRFAP